MNAGLELEIGATKRNTLVNSKGIKYLDFKGTLTPKYYLVWLHLLLGYLALVVIAVAIVGLHTYRPELFPLSVLLGGVLLGYVIAHNQLFLHEATHYNLTKSRKLNDLLANLFVGSLTGQNVRTYRVVHFQHHRKLGAPEDTENSYFAPPPTSNTLSLSPGMALKILLNIRLSSRLLMLFANERLGIPNE